MGRTVLPFNQKILSIESEWNKFRRALRKEDQELLDDLFGFAKYHSAPSSYFSTPNPMEPVLMAMLIEILKEVRRLKFELRAKEEDLDVREKSD
ncbi:MAG: hypothetical protein IH856_22770 [Deltaproteobacteria bacterium]|nr:hypothetical protein [Deltaproteobacteria bacterium]MCZ6549088.1 hypothetical protein [Deltaproteobacteria bacterium]